MVTQSGPQAPLANLVPDLLASEERRLYEHLGQAQRHAADLTSALEQTRKGIENYLDAIGQVEEARATLGSGE